MPGLNSLQDMTTFRVQLSDGSVREFQASSIEFSQQREVTPFRNFAGDVDLIPGQTTQTFNIVMKAKVESPEPSPSRYDILKASTK